MSKSIFPPAVIGIIGGGQLGMMIVREAQRMGYRSVVWDPDPDCPASRLADETITASFADRDAARKMAERSDVITYEFENVDPDIVEWIEQSKPVFPGSPILRVAQHRRFEKEELQRRGFPTVPFQPVATKEELQRAVKEIGLPVVVKTATAGYDGKGQTVLQSQSEVDGFLKDLDELQGEYVVEKFIELDCEVSVVAVRGKDGFVTSFPVCENVHRENILHTTTVPTHVDPKVQADAIKIGRAIMEAFNIVGVLCTEMFVTTSGEVLVNELAPRPHNSGHFSLDACDVSQFEMVVRAVCDLPLKEPRLLSPCTMINLLGKHLERVDINELLAIPGVKLHLYGKKVPQPKRKMGHVTVLNYSKEEVNRCATRIKKMIGEEDPAGIPTARPIASEKISIS